MLFQLFQGKAVHESNEPVPSAESSTRANHVPVAGSTQAHFHGSNWLTDQAQLVSTGSPFLEMSQLIGLKMSHPKLVNEHTELGKFRLKLIC